MLTVHMNISFLLAAMSLAGALAPRAAAQYEPEKAPDLATDEPLDRLRFEMGFDIYSDYFYRGILIEDDGFIFQPYANMEYDVIAGDSCTITLDAGVWTSFHNNRTDAHPDRSDFFQTWYDADYDLGAAIGWDQFSLRLGFAFYTSPSGAYDSYEEVTLTFEVDDSERLGGWAMSPYVMVAQELGDRDSDGERFERATYLEFGVTPGIDITGLPPLPEATRLDFPIVLGLSLNDYYEAGTGDDEIFGFLSVGALLTVPLPWLEGLSLNGGVEYLLLGDAARLFNTGEDRDEWLWHVGMALGF